MNRYERQISYRNLGEGGQKKLSLARAAVVGAGALGSVSANELVRAGIGFLRIIDGDRLDITNLHRQILYTENDMHAGLLKAQAAAAHLSQANSDVAIEPICERLTADNASTLLANVDIVLDATDNMESRYIINEYCVKHRLPWVYGGAVASEGMCASFLPDGPCFSCFTGTDRHAPDAPDRSCRTFGVLNSLTAIVASLQVTEAIKIITGANTVRKNLLYIEVWDNEWQEIPLVKNPTCPICGK